MGQSVKITKYLGKDKNGNDEFVISVPPTKEWDGNPSEDTIKVQHDYVEFKGSCNFELEHDVKKPDSQKIGASNWLSSVASLQISIKDMYSFILPFLNKHKYLQPEHFKVRDSGELPYLYEGSIINYKDDNGVHMVAFRRVGEENHNNVSRDVFDLIKNDLKLSYSQNEINKEQD